MNHQIAKIEILFKKKKRSHKTKRGIQYSIDVPFLENGTRCRLIIIRIRIRLDSTRKITKRMTENTDGGERLGTPPTSCNTASPRSTTVIFSYFLREDRVRNSRNLIPKVEPYK